jgi:hypothetical protein
MSSIDGRPKSIRTPATHMSRLNSRPTSLARSPAIPYTPAWISSHSTRSSRPSGWYGSHSSSSARIASRNPRSMSCRARTIARSSSVRQRDLPPFGLGAGGAHLGEVVTPDNTLVGVTTVMARTCEQRPSDSPITWQWHPVGCQVPSLGQGAGPAARRSLRRRELMR